MAEHVITKDAELETFIGKPIPLVDAKAIDFIDEGALAWIAKTPLIFANFGDRSTLGVTVGGGAPGFITANSRELILPVAMLDDPGLARPGFGFGSILLLPGINDILRVNGKVAEVSGEVIAISVEECYMHCGRALMRSEFWDPEAPGDAPAEIAAFIPESRFMALATISAAGDADLSPKGDRAGTMARLDDGRFWFADRPGNRRLDSFHNILGQPRIAAMVVIPGTTRVVRLTGTAKVTTNEEVRPRFTVQEKTPGVVVEVDYENMDSVESAALARANLWPITPTEGIKASEISLQHLKLSKNLKARVAANLITGAGKVMKEGAFADKMEEELRKNLF